MQNAQNTNSNFTVENLVAKYRKYVSEHCPMSVNICEGNNGKMVDVYAPVSPDANADEQLLITLYSSVAGCKADKDVLNALSRYAEKYQKEALTEEEFAFLCSNFEDVVAYEFSHRTEWGWENNCQSDKSTDFLPHKSHHAHNTSKLQSFEIIKTLAKPEVGQIVFITDSGYCDVAMLFPGCTIKGYTAYSKDGNETWALGQIRLYAAGLKSEILPTAMTGLTPEYMSDVDYAIYSMSPYSSKLFCEGVTMMCQHMHPNGKMYLFMNWIDAAGNSKTLNLRKMLVEERLIDSIFSFQEDDDESLSIPTKKVFISASRSTHHTVRMQRIPGDMFEIASDTLDHEILWPSYYAAKKPEGGVPLSSIVSFVDLDRKWDNEWDKEYFIQRKDGEYVLSEKIKKMPVATPADMAADYKDANLCEANLKLAGDSLFEKWTGWIRRVEQPSILLYGNKEKFVVGYVKDMPDKGLATLDTIVCLIPKEGIDVRYVATLLLSLEIKEQIITICEGEVSDRTFPLIMNKVIVPNHSDKERLSFLAEANYNAIISTRKEMEKRFSAKLEAEKTAYINEVRQRKHDMGQYIFDLQNTEDLMRYYMENLGGENYNPELWNLLNSFRSSLTEFSTMFDNLAKEEVFFAPETFNITEYLSNLPIRQHSKEYRITFHIDSDSIVRYNSQFTKDPSQDTAPSIKVSPENFYRMVSNVLDNAKKHGFRDSSRKDYEVHIDVSIDSMENKYIIEFRNNGIPFPKGMDKTRYGLKGEKAGQYANTGLGGYYVRRFVEHYNGDYDIFMDGNWNVVRIFLPIN